MCLTWHYMRLWQKDNPPVVIFLVFLLSCAVVIFNLAMFANFKATGPTKIWNEFLNHLAASKYCRSSEIADPFNIGHVFSEVPGIKNVSIQIPILYTADLSDFKPVLLKGTVSLQFGIAGRKLDLDLIALQLAQTNDSVCLSVRSEDEIILPSNVHQCMMNFSELKYQSGVWFPISNASTVCHDPQPQKIFTLIHPFGDPKSDSRASSCLMYSSITVFLSAAGLLLASLAHYASVYEALPQVNIDLEES